MYSQTGDIVIEHISTEEGLSQRHAHCVMEDSYGFLWFGTGDGLTRYDGHEFVVYKHNPWDTTSLTSPIISLLTEDENGNIWVGGFYGLYLYQRYSNSFIHYAYDPKNDYSISDDGRIRAIVIDRNKSNYVWIGTEEGGLNLFDTELQRFFRFGNDPDNHNFLNSDNIRALCQDSFGNLWIGTGDAGLVKLNLNSIPLTSNGKYDETKFDSIVFEHYLTDQKESGDSDSPTVLNIYEDRTKSLWVLLDDSQILILNKETGSFASALYFRDAEHIHFHEMLEDRNGMLWFGSHNSLFQLNRKTKKTREFKFNTQDPRSYSNQGLCEDKAGNIWFATWDGIIKINRNKPLFKHYYHIDDFPSSLHNNNVNAILVDRSGITWIGTNKGLEVMERDINGSISFINYSALHKISGTVRSVVEDSKGSIWASIDNNLIRINSKNRSIVQYNNDILEVDHLLIDDNENLWISSWNGGITRVRLDNLYSVDNLRDCELKNYFNDPDDPARSVHNFIQDRFGLFWICTEMAGVFVFDPQSGSIKNYKRELNNPESLSINYANVVFEDTRGTIWIGTFGGGLNKFNRESESFNHFTMNDGLPSNVIRGIIEDIHGNLWISSDRGITKYNPANNKFRNYDVTDGLQKTDLFNISFCDARTGKMYLGGNNGINVFHPDSLKESTYVPPVAITKFTRYSDEIVGNLLIDRNVSAKEKIELSYEDDIISFEFAALSYKKNDKCEYAYKLEGLNNNWIDLGTKREITFMNLNPGDYTFKLKCCNEDGIWNEKAASIQIHISPPWWQTWWAYTIYIFGFIGLLTGIRSYELNRRKEKEDRRILELENERKSSELEEARQLQLSMLPRELPHLSQLDIAVQMKTATEVGGDFYDFHLNDAGTLTVIVTDATGHGMQAGTMVTATKGLFQNLAELADLEQMFHQFNRAICAMGLQPLLNAILVLRVKGKQLEIISGGMPDLLIYRKNNDSVKEIESSGPPLGAFCDYTYKLCKTKFSQGDVILSMSDGFIERFNENNEALGYERCKQIFKEIAFTSSRQMIDRFLKAGDEWGGSRQQDDDITFVVMKCN